MRRYCQDRHADQSEQCIDKCQLVQAKTILDVVVSASAVLPILFDLIDLPQSTLRIGDRSVQNRSDEHPEYSTGTAAPDSYGDTRDICGPDTVADDGAEGRKR